MRGRGDRRGRGRSNGSGQFASTIERTTSLQRQPAISGDNSTSEVDAQKKEQEQSTLELSPGADAEICFICASPVVHNSIAPCGHRTCHICALRLRALYKNKSCAHCRVSLTFRNMLRSFIELIYLYRQMPARLFSQTTLSSNTKTLLHLILHNKILILESIMRSKKYTKILFCFSDTTVPIPAVM